MSEKAKKIAEKLRDSLKEYNDFIGLYLYGSQINNKAHKDSDIDIVAVFEKNENENETILKAWDLEIEHNVVIDFHPFSVEQLNLNPFYYNEIKKGLYYAR